MSRDYFLELWNRLQATEWFQQLPPWMREPPGLYLTLGAAALGVLTLLFFCWYFLRSAPKPRQNRLKEALRSERRELEELERVGNWRVLGERYEQLGKPRQALDAYRRGACHPELAKLLLESGKRAEAKEVARTGHVWALYAELAEADGQMREAALGYERSEQPLKAARCYERAELRHEAAACYLKAGDSEKAALLLLKTPGRRSAEQLEAIVRKTLATRRGAALSRTLQLALQHAAQVWIAEGEAQRAYRLVADAEQWSLAVPIARDHLPPSPELAATIARAGALEVAADLYHKLGDRRQEALLRADHALGSDQPAEAARWFEAAEEWGSAAEQWAASGEPRRAAALYERSGDLRSAAELYARVGDTAKERELLLRLQASDAPTSLDFARTHLTPVSARASGGASGPGLLGSSVEPGERYVLQEVIGRGGMGVVHRALDRTLQREVAYKVLPVEAADEAEGEGLLAEARAAAKLSHPNIVQVFDAGRDERGYFIVMELIAGETIQALLKRQRFTIPGALFIGRQICAALAHAHERRIIHRDLKPSNLLWTTAKLLKLTDFGLARIFEAESAQVMTRAAGTPFYMAPEQIRGEAVSPQTDLYALGCVLYELLCGRSPFAGTSSVYHHLNTPAKSPAECREGVPEKLVALILRCLEKDPAARPGSAGEVARELAALETSARA